MFAIRKQGFRIYILGNPKFSGSVLPFRRALLYAMHVHARVNAKAKVLRRLALGTTETLQM